MFSVLCKNYTKLFKYETLLLIPSGQYWQRYLLIQTQFQYKSPYTGKPNSIAYPKVLSLALFTQGILEPPTVLVPPSNHILYQTSLGLLQELGEAESSKCITMTRAPESGLQSQQPKSQEDMFTFCSVKKSKVSSVHYKRNRTVQFILLLFQQKHP